jgi:predicted alpha/beta-fold hydrolase
MDIAPFQSHRLFRGGHLQTLGAVLWTGAGQPHDSPRHIVTLPDGDQIVLHDDLPRSWTEGAPAALLVHGLVGCHASPYMVRVADKLTRAGLRVFRMDLRGCGAGLKLARYTYNAGRSADVASAIESIRELCPGSSISVVGFSLGGNVLLKLLGESPCEMSRRVTSAVAICPPVDLLACVRGLQRPLGRLYDAYFTRCLWKLSQERRRCLPDAPWPGVALRPRCLYALDDSITAPLGGFAGADDYYARSSSLQFLPHVNVPTLILASQDDPLVTPSVWNQGHSSPSIRLYLSRGGGHLGFLGRGGADPDGRWMDWRIVEWILHHSRTLASEHGPVALSK